MGHRVREHDDVLKEQFVAQRRADVVSQNCAEGLRGCEAFVQDAEKRFSERMANLQGDLQERFLDVMNGEATRSAMQHLDYLRREEAHELEGKMERIMHSLCDGRASVDRSVEDQSCQQDTQEHRFRSTLGGSLYVKKLPRKES